MDGLGLAMFIPLLQAVNSSNGVAPESESGGLLDYFTGLIQRTGLELNVFTVLGTMVLLFVLKGLIKYIQLSYYASLRQLFIKKVRYSLVDTLQNLSFSAFLKLDAGKIQNTLTGEVARLMQTMTYFFYSGQATVMLSTYVFLAVLANYQFALLVAVVSILSNLLYRKIYKATQAASNELTERNSDFNGYLIPAIHYFKYLKSTNTFQVYARKLKNTITELEYLGRRINQLNAISMSMKEPIIIAIVSIVIVVQLKWFGSTLDSIIFSLLLFYRALGFLITLQTNWQGFIEFSGGMNAVARMSNEMNKNKEKLGDAPFRKLKEQLTFENVDFYYGSKKALDNIDIVIPVKKTIALVGESGSGKTTLANMVAGLFIPNEGTISIDGKSITSINLNSYREKIGYISQESVIFNDSIYNNITFWAEKTPENLERFNDVIEMASLKEFINSLPDKEATKMGDNGILISGGQKQRISIARELFKDAEILILDEATSALDSETEKIIQKNIEKLHGSYTMILIAHRLSTIKEADIIYLLENGKVTASGSFYEVMEKSSRFRKMVSLQTV